MTPKESEGRVRWCPLHGVSDPEGQKAGECGYIDQWGRECTVGIYWVRVAALIKLIDPGFQQAARLTVSQDELEALIADTLLDLAFLEIRDKK